MIKTEKDPTNQVVKNLKQLLKKTQLTEKPEQLQHMNPRPPTFQGYVKTHKATEELHLKDVPIRPVVATYQSPTYKLEKFLVNMFWKHSNWKPEYSIKNSIDLVNKLPRDKLPRNAKLVSLDVDSLFTNVDVNETIEALKDILVNQSNMSTSEIREFCNLVKFTTDNNYFEYKNEYYKLTEGLPMGAPISPLLAEIYMNRYDTIICRDLTKWKSKILCYFRYVDDVYLVWVGSKRELNQFHQDINQLKSKLKFKLELGDKELNFLDLRTRIQEEQIFFEIFRKPGYTDAVIPSTSHHSYQHKMSAFHCLLDRLLAIPLTKKAYNKELDVIFQIAQNNGYEKREISRLLRRKKEKIENALLYNTKPHQKEKWMSIPYVANLSEEIKNTITANQKVNLTFSNSKNLGNLLRNTKSDNQDPLTASGVYKVTCECKKVYVGQSGRSVKIRTKEHFSCAKRNKKGMSSLSDHLINTRHDPDNCEVAVLHKCEKSRKLNFLEQLEIEKHQGDNLLNTQTESQVATLVLPSTLMQSLRQHTTS